MTERWGMRGGGEGRGGGPPLQGMLLGHTQNPPHVHKHTCVPSPSASALPPANGEGSRPTSGARESPTGLGLWQRLSL